MVRAVSDPTLPLLTRLWFSLVCALRMLVDGSFAHRVWRVREADEPKALPNAKAEPKRPADESALVLLALLQREGRLVDFLEQDISSFDDEDVGVAARVVHEGCKRALAAHAEIAPVRDEEEESRVEIEDGYRPDEVKLTGHIGPRAPYRGTLKHRGWRVLDLRLPQPTTGHDPRVVAPAEVEL